MSRDGAFAVAYGKLDTAPLRALRGVLNELARSCRDQGIPVVLVTSRYETGQFRVCEHLCDSEEGCASMVDGPFDLVITKTTMNVLDCSKRDRQVGSHLPASR